MPAPSDNDLPAKSAGHGRPPSSARRNDRRGRPQGRGRLSLGSVVSTAARACLVRCGAAQPRLAVIMSATAAMPFGLGWYGVWPDGTSYFSTHGVAEQASWPMLALAASITVAR